MFVCVFVFAGNSATRRYTCCAKSGKIWAGRRHDWCHVDLPFFCTQIWIWKGLRSIDSEASKFKFLQSPQSIHVSHYQYHCWLHIAAKLATWGMLEYLTLNFLPVLLITLIPACLSHHFIEKPCASVFRKFSERCYAPVPGQKFSRTLSRQTRNDSPFAARCKFTRGAYWNDPFHSGKARQAYSELFFILIFFRHTCGIDVHVVKPRLFRPNSSGILTMKPDQVLYIFLVGYSVLCSMVCLHSLSIFAFLKLFESVASCLLQLAFILPSQNCFSAFTSAGHFPDLVRLKSFDSFCMLLIYMFGVPWNSDQLDQQRPGLQIGSAEPSFCDAAAKPSGLAPVNGFDWPDVSGLGWLRFQQRAA